jgi:hypothetical protein
MQFGAYTFVETRRDPLTSEPVDVDEAFANVIEQIELADPRTQGGVTRSHRGYVSAAAIRHSVRKLQRRKEDQKTGEAAV